MSFLKPKAAKSTSSSKNEAYGFLKESYAPTVQLGNQATNFLSSLLMGGPQSGEAAGAFENYKALAGYAPALRDMQRDTVGSGAARGLLRSGATSNALLRRGAELDQQTFGNFLQQLAGISGLGVQGGNLIAGAGNVSSGTSNGGGPSTLGTIASVAGSLAPIFSDRRTKTNIHHVTDFEDGLGLYVFQYRGDDEIRIGVMADEVAEIRPWALGPEVGGFMTVNYSKL